MTPRALARTLIAALVLAGVGPGALAAPALERPPTLSEPYHWYILGTIILVALQAALIAGLLVERRRRRRAQARVTERLRFEALVARVSATFAGLPTPEVDEHIRDCLRQITLVLGVDRATLWQVAPDQGTLLATHAWSGDGVPPPPPALALSLLPLVRDTGKHGWHLSFTRPDELPAQAEGGRRALDRHGVKSLLAVSLQIDDQRLGLLALVTIHRHRGWPAELVQGAHTLADLFANALMRTRTTTALEQSAAVSDAVLAALPGEAAIVDGGGVILRVNAMWAARAAARGPRSLTGQAVGTNYLAACREAASTSEQARRVSGALASVLDERQAEASVEYARPSPGEERWVEMRARRLPRPGAGAVVIHLDITARRQADAEAQRHLRDIAHLNRVAAMGELAASLAHELNQPLTAILSNAQAAQQFLERPAPDLEEVRACVGDIVRNDRRAGEIVRRVRGLVRKDVVASVPLDLNAQAENVIGLVATDALLHQVSIALVPAPGLPEVHGDPVQIQQVALNLLLNALAAAADSGAPRQVTVRTAAAEGQVELSVHDSGKGISEGDLTRIFEPFYTTRREGLGMGLAICRSIVEALGGRIWAENSPAGGAMFRVRLPARPGPAP